MTAAHAFYRENVGALPGLFDEIAVDLFAGGGGMSLGFELATGRCVDEAINHDADAIWMHQANHRNTRHWRDSVWRVDPLEVAAGRPVGWLHGSPGCTHFSIARGGKPVKKEIRGLAWCVLRWTAKLLPRLLTMENVREFLTWGPLLQKKAGRNRWLWEVTRPGQKGKKVRFPVEGPHADDGSAPAWQRMLEALGYQVEPLMYPDPKRRGVTFEQWRRQLEDLGYEVQVKVLDAADYGAPTHRRRLFVVARRDGRPIRWPEKTHGNVDRADGAGDVHDLPEPVGLSGLLRRPALAGFRSAAAAGCHPDRSLQDTGGREVLRPGRSGKAASRSGRRPGDRRDVVLKPFRTAAECIRFDLPCPSIFGRKKDLADNTLKRIVRGLVKFTIDSDDPFIVQVNHGGEEFRGQAIDEPLPTLSAKHGFGLTVPYTVGTGGRSPEPRELARPFGTVLPRDWPALISPHITQYNGLKGGEARGFDLGQPFNVVPTENRFGCASAFLYDRYGERAGQDPRARDVHRPMGAITATANGGNLVAPYMVGVANSKTTGRAPYAWPMGEPLRTITSSNDKAVVVPFLAQTSNTNGHGDYVRSLSRPVGTITTADVDQLISPLAVKFYRTGVCQPVSEPLDTVTGRHRFGFAAAHLTKLRGSGGWLGVDQPLDTICAGAATFGLTAAWVVKHYGGNFDGAGIGCRQPIDTITAVDHHAVATAFITHLRGTHGHGAGGSGLSMWDVLPTITAGGGHLYLTRATLARLPGTGSPSTDATIYTPRELMGPSDNPAINRGFWRVYDLLRRFLGDKAPLPIVRKGGVEYLIYDIGMRMLTPRELLAAQFSPELAEDYVLTGTRESQVAKIGNSVPPLLGAAVVRANWDAEESGVAA
jgi:DNA (cytosine-5)-methyltransferase 1